jgi:hypothetical protein
MMSGSVQLKHSLRCWGNSFMTSLCRVIICIGLPCTFPGACTAPYRHAQLRPSDSSFSGIDAALGGTELPASRQVNVLLIHGMGTHTTDWALSLMSQVSQALSLRWTGPLPNPETLANGALLYQVVLSDETRVAHIAAVLWSPITADAKKTLCYDATQATPTCTASNTLSKDKRARINADLKNQLMDDAMSDVTFYMNESGGKRVREAIEDALLRTLSNEGMTLASLSSGAVPTAKNVPLFIISESLGSKMIVDSLQEFESDRQTQTFAQQARGNIHSLFLLANQIPLLNLGLVDSNGRPDPYQHLKKLARDRHNYRKNRLPTSPLQVVAFSDPNDLLTYQLQPDALPPDEATISNVVVSNDCTWFGLFENPDTAHTGYFETNPVVNAIAHGSASVHTSVGGRCAKQH